MNDAHSRASAHAYGEVTGDAVFWLAARARGEFTARQLLADTGRTQNAVHRWLRKLVGDGTVELLRREGVTRWYGLTTDEAYPATRHDGRVQSVEQNLWTAIRGLKSFSALDAMAHAATEEQPVSEAEAVAYCRALLKAGYLRVRQLAVPGQRHARYRLIHNTGPLPPVTRRVTALHDPNTGAWHHAEAGQ